MGKYCLSSALFCRGQRGEAVTQGGSSLTMKDSQVYHGGLYILASSIAPRPSINNLNIISWPPCWVYGFSLCRFYTWKVMPSYGIRKGVGVQTHWSCARKQNDKRNHIHVISIVKRSIHSNYYWMPLPGCIFFTIIMKRRKRQLNWILLFMQQVIDDPRLFLITIQVVILANWAGVAIVITPC